MSARRAFAAACRARPPACVVLSCNAQVARQRPPTARCCLPAPLVPPSPDLCRTCSLRSAHWVNVLSSPISVLASMGSCRGGPGRGGEIRIQHPNTRLQETTAHACAVQRAQRRGVDGRCAHPPGLPAPPGQACSRVRCHGEATSHGRATACSPRSCPFRARPAPRLRAAARSRRGRPAAARPGTAPAAHRQINAVAKQSWVGRQRTRGGAGQPLAKQRAGFL